MSVSPVVLDDLRDAYLRMKNRKAEIRAEVRERYREKIEAEIEFESQIAEREFAVRLVEVREMGATRPELVSVIRDGTAATMRRYIELGGGTIAGRKTGADRLAERAESINVERVSETVFKWSAENGEEVTLEICWLNDSPRVRGVDSENHEALVVATGRKSSVARELAAQIVTAYGLTTDTGVQVS